MLASKKYLMGFDIGTQGSKGIIIDFEGNLAAYSYCPHDVIHKKPEWAEHDAVQTWWGDFITVARDLIGKSGIAPEAIASIGISALFPCMLPVDESGKPLRNAILYGIDTRTEEDIRFLNEQIGKKRIWDLTKGELSTQSVGPKILWFKRNEPELFKRTEKFLQASEFVVAKLTGKYVADRSTAKETAPFYNFDLGQWDGEMCREVDIEMEQLPDICEAYEIAGTVTQQASAQTGLSEGTPVVAGTGDFLAELLSMGGNCGDTLITYGSTIQVFHMTDRPVFVDSLTTVIYPVDGLHVVGGGTAASGSITKWFRDEFGSEERNIEKVKGINAFKQLSDSASAIPAGSDGLVLLPYFAGERSPIWDPKARGIIAGLTHFHTKAHLYRAVLEGTCYSIRQHLDVMKAAGLHISGLVSTGGGIKSHLWTQIMSDVTGAEQLCFSNSMGAPAGDAYLAGIGVGAFKDMSVMREKWIKEPWIVKPNPNNQTVYEKCYEVYQSLYPAIKRQMHALAEIADIKK
jgi:xylulokinase